MNSDQNKAFAIGFLSSLTAGLILYLLIREREAIE
jgi:hypothetical protein